jgi:hypothetical protein
MRWSPIVFALISSLSILSVHSAWSQDAQSVDEITNRLRDAEALRDQLQEQLEHVELEISQLNAQLKIIESRLEEQDGLVVVCKRKIDMYLRTSSAFSPIAEIEAGEPFLLLGYEERHWFSARANGIEGYVYLYIDSDCPDTDAEKRAKINQMVAEHSEALRAAEEGEKAAEEAARAARKAQLVSRYGAEAAAAIMARKVWVGMSKEMAIESIGRPSSVNRTVTGSSVSEQWVYRDKVGGHYRYYLYFVDGRLQSWQD